MSKTDTFHGEIRCKILCMLKNGGVSRHKLFEECYYIIPPEKAYRIWSNDYLRGRKNNITKSEPVKKDPVRSGRKRILINILWDLRRRNIIGACGDVYFLTNNKD